MFTASGTEFRVHPLQAIFLSFHANVDLLIVTRGGAAILSLAKTGSRTTRQTRDTMLLQTATTLPTESLFVRISPVLYHNMYFLYL
jgi:hypothetical protein